MTRMILASLVTLALVPAVAAAQAPAGGRPAASPTQTAPRPATPGAPAPAAQAPAAAPAPVPFPADARIGFVNMQFVVSESKLGKVGTDKMKELTDKKSAELSALQKDVQTRQQELSTGANVLSPAVITQKNAELDKMSRELQFRQDQAQVDIQNLQQQLLDEFSAKVLPIVEQVRSEKNLWFILSSGDGSGVAAMHPGLDLSQEVIKRLDASK